ncbi:hypothetical protein GDO81_019369 [Engystomops pustulosus]|uniref:Uncharacterized protein n=1 Tax=Engystomops pustulosus TaxID=76066 RepID=A0AAV6ZAP8_ENGPU|nr:hypothetical protein GDO81_019369 [Engystomops pustulosus]KAG8546263.1 hypothetical protein GDO81_019369 [Engystomops pustulosus]
MMEELLLIFILLGYKTFSCLTLIHLCSYVSEMSQFIKVKSKEDESEDESEDDYSRHFPTFIWTGRDVTLKRNLHGRPVTDDEFLENALTPRETIHNKNNVRNQYKERIRTYFKSRKCFMFDPPSGDNNVVQNMDKASDDQLSEGFKVQTNNFCDYIYENVDVKCVDDNIVTGKILAELVIMYTETICSSNAICVEHVVNSISMAENTRAVNEAIQHYQKKMEENVVFPTETLDEISEKCEKEALEKFKKISFKDKDHQFQRQLAENIEKERRKFSERNDMESLNRCENLIEELSKDLERRSYARLGGYQMVMKEMKRIEEEYKKAPRKGNKAEEVFQKFKKSKLMIASNIMEFEKVLEEKLKQEEEKRRKEEEERTKGSNNSQKAGYVAGFLGAAAVGGLSCLKARAAIGGGAAIAAGGGGAAGAAITATSSASVLTVATVGIGLVLVVGIAVTVLVIKNRKHKSEK